MGRSSEGGHGNQLWYSCLENPHGQRNLVGYSSWGHKESDTTEQLNTAQHSTESDDSNSKTLDMGRTTRRNHFLDHDRLVRQVGFWLLLTGPRASHMAQW